MFYEEKIVNTQPHIAAFIYFTSFICPLFVHTECIKQGGGNMIGRKIILDTYQKGPDAVVSLLGVQTHHHKPKESKSPHNENSIHC